MIMIGGVLGFSVGSSLYTSRLGNGVFKGTKTKGQRGTVLLG